MLSLTSSTLKLYLLLLIMFHFVEIYVTHGHGLWINEYASSADSLFNYCSDGNIRNCSSGSLASTENPQEEYFPSTLTGYVINL